MSDDKDEKVIGESEQENFRSVDRESRAGDPLLKDMLGSSNDSGVNPRTCMQRWFGTMQPESVRGSMLALSATAIGGGVLSLPYVCRLCGLILGFGMLLLGFFATVWSFSLMISSDVRKNAELRGEGKDKKTGIRSIKEFCLQCVGPKMLKAYELIAIFYLYGSLVGYQIIISNLIQGALKAMGVEEEVARNYRLYHIIGVSILTYPLCLLRSVNSLRYATFVSIGAIAYTAIILVIQVPFFWGTPMQGDLELFKLDWNFFNAFGITFFAFTCQAGFYAALDKLEKRDEVHMKKVAYRSCFINLTFYSIIALAGYLSSRSLTPDIIIYRTPPKGFGPFVNIAQFLIAGGLCIGIPLNYVPLRTAVHNQLFENPEYTLPR